MPFSFTGGDLVVLFRENPLNAVEKQYKVEYLVGSGKVTHYVDHQKFVSKESDGMRNYQDVLTLEENRTANGGTANRSVTVNIYTQDSFGEWSDPVTQVCTNPAPTFPTPPLIAPTYDGALIRITPPADADLMGYKIWMHTSPTGVTTSGSIVHLGAESNVYLPIPDYSPRYFVVAPYDRFGDDVVNVSSVLSTTRASVGSLGVSGFLTNESHLITADAAGTVTGSYASAGGTFRVYSGSSEVTGSGVTYSVTSSSNVTVTIAATGVYTVSALTADEGTATLQAVYDPGAGPITITKTYQISKSKAGADGSSAVVITLTSDRQNITHDAFGTPGAGQTTTFTVFKQNTTAAVTWTISDLSGTNKTPLATYLNATGDTAAMTTAQFTSARGSTNGVIVTATVGGVSDKISVIKVQDGAAGPQGNPGVDGVTPIVGYLTNEAHTISADSSGTVTGSLAAAGGTFVVLNGATTVPAASVTFSVQSSSNVGITIASTGVYTISSVTADTATAVLRAVYSGVTIDKLYTISKSKAGAGGANAQTLVVTSNVQAVHYNASDGLLAANPTITFTAQKQNTSATVNWTVQDFTGASKTPVTTYLSAASGDSVTMTPTQYNNARGSTGGVIVTGTLNGTSISDLISIVKVNDGAAGSDGAPGSPGTPAPQVQFQWSVNGSTLWHSGYVSGDLYLRQSTDGGVTWGTAVRVVGADGADGDAGLNAKTLSITADRETITFDATGNLNPATQTITFNTFKQNTTGTVTWTAKRLDGTTIPPNQILFSATSGDTITLLAADFNAMRGTTEGITVTGSITDGTTFSDKVTITRLQSGTAGFNLVNDNSADTALTVNSVTRIGTVANSAAHTKEGYATSLACGCRIPQTGQVVAFGLHNNPTLNNNANSMACYFLTSGTNTWTIYEGTVSSGITGTYTTADRFEVRREAALVNYYKNGTLLRSLSDPTVGQVLYGKFIVQGVVTTQLAEVDFSPMAASGVQGYLTNEAWVAPADSAGNVSSYAGSNGTFRVFSGVTEITNSGGVSYAQSGGTGGTWVINSNGTYTFSNMTADTATVTFTATHTQSGAVISKIYTATKSKTGQTGDRRQFIFKRQAGQPATPTGNGIPAGWADAPPAADGNPVWMSSANQTSAGVTDGAGWSTPIHAEGVDGLNGTRFDLMFIRSTSAPATPAAVPYPSGWSEQPAMSGQGGIWVTRALKKYDGTLLSGWSTPTLWNGTTNRGAWASGQAYILYDVVTYNGGTYMAVTPHTSANTNAPTGTGQSNTNWEVVSAPAPVSGTGTGGVFTATINITGNSAGGSLVNLRSYADAAGYNGIDSATITFNLNGSQYGIAGQPGQKGGTALDTGTWPTGKSINLTLNLVSCALRGGGGGGGAGGSYGVGQRGGDGGDAIVLRTNLTVSGTGSIVGGSAGGGGGGYAMMPTSWDTSTNTSSDGRPYTTSTGPYVFYGGGGGGGGGPNGLGGPGGSGLAADQTTVTTGPAGVTANGFIVKLGGQQPSPPTSAYAGNGGNSGDAAGSLFSNTEGPGTLAQAGGLGSVSTTNSSVSGGAGGSNGLWVRRNGFTLTQTGSWFYKGNSAL